jgi:hypothetical protein
MSRVKRCFMKAIEKIIIGFNKLRGSLDDTENCEKEI